MTNHGPITTNPHDPNRTPGGSSCGSAAAVADWQVTLSLGAQTGGSIIRPASYTGVFAMKPTFDAILLQGQKPFAPTYDTFGFFARSVEDLQLLASVFAIEDDQPPRDVPLEELSVALMKTPFWSLAGPGTVAAMQETENILRAKGVKVEEVSFPPDMADGDVLGRIQRVITHSEARVSFLREYRAQKSMLAREIRDLVENTSNYTLKERTEASDTYSTMRHTINDLTEDYSLIITPSAVDEAPLGLGNMGSATFNTMWTVSTLGYFAFPEYELCLTDLSKGFHMPVINIPPFVGAHGMPISVSLVSPRFTDQQLLRTSRILGEILVAEGGWKSRLCSSAAKTTPPNLLET